MQGPEASISYRTNDAKGPILTVVRCPTAQTAQGTPLPGSGKNGQSGAFLSGMRLTANNFAFSRLQLGNTHAAHEANACLREYRFRLEPWLDAKAIGNHCVPVVRHLESLCGQSIPAFIGQ